MRLNLRRALNPNHALKGLAWQAGGVVVSAVTNKYIANNWARWAIFIGSAAAGIWFPITMALLKATHLDEQIENV